MTYWRWLFPYGKVYFHPHASRVDKGCRKLDAKVIPPPPPLIPRRLKLRRVALLVVATVWVLALCVSLPPLLEWWGHYVPDRANIRCTRFFRNSKILLPAARVREMPLVMLIYRLLFPCAISCGPNWGSPEDFGYALYIFAAGFLVPVAVIVPSNAAVVAAMRKVSQSSPASRPGLLYVYWTIDCLRFIPRVPNPFSENPSRQFGIGRKESAVILFI